MRLQVITPLEIAVDADDVASVRAEDSTGGFGILPHHADFVTDLAVSVVTWFDQAGAEHRIAVRGGVLRVEHGDLVQIATRQAVGGDTLESLGAAVLEKLREEARAESEARVSTTRMYVGLVRQIERYLEAGRGFVPMAGGAVVRPSMAEAQGTGEPSE
jgi:F-type H+-transporting ATPase subunit epsilon